MHYVWLTANANANAIFFPATTFRQLILFPPANLKRFARSVHFHIVRKFNQFVDPLSTKTAEIECELQQNLITQESEYITEHIVKSHYT